MAANVSVGKGTSKFTFSGLAPGHKYLLEVVSVAGPYAASAGNISDWTSKWQELEVLASCMRLSLPQLGRLSTCGGKGQGLLPGSCRYFRSNGIMGCASTRWRGEQGNTAAHRTVWQPWLLFQEADLQLMASLFTQAGSSRHG